MKLAALEVARSLHDGELLLMDAPATPSPPPPDASSSEAAVRSADVTIDASRGLWARVFCPSPAIPAAAAAVPLPVVVYFHGGGFVHFSPSSRPYDAFCRRLCAALAAVVVSVSYRVAPHHRFPAAYDDGVTALRFLDDDDNPLLLPSAAAVEVDLSSCFLIGDSSGANMVHPAARVCGVGVELADAFPPAIMVVSGGLDLLRDWHARYVEALRGKGKVVTVVDYPDAFHGFYAFPELEDSGRLLRDMKLFVDDHRSKSNASRLDSGGV